MLRRLVPIPRTPVEVLGSSLHLAPESFELPPAFLHFLFFTAQPFQLALPATEEPSFGFALTGFLALTLQQTFEALALSLELPLAPCVVVSAGLLQRPAELVELAVAGSFALEAVGELA